MSLCSVLDNVIGTSQLLTSSGGSVGGPTGASSHVTESGPLCGPPDWESASIIQ